MSKHRFSPISPDELSQLDLLRAHRRVHRKHVLSKPQAAPEHFVAPAIMMSQNRQSELDRKHAENDYEINVKAELEIELLHEKIDLMKGQELLTLTEAVRSLWAQLDAILQRNPPQTIAQSALKPP
jgi:hypothetical protein